MVKHLQQAPVPCTRLHHDRSGVTPRKSAKKNRTQEILGLIRDGESRDDGDRSAESIAPCDESEDDRSFPVSMPSHSESSAYAEDNSSVGGADISEGRYSDVADSRDEEERETEEETDDMSFSDANLNGLRYEPCDRTPEPTTYGFNVASNESFISSDNGSNLVEIAHDYVTSPGANTTGSVNSGSNTGKSEDSDSLWGPMPGPSDTDGAPETETVESESVQNSDMRGDESAQDEEEEETTDGDHDLGSEAQIENVTKVTWKPNKKGVFSFLKRSVSSKNASRNKSLSSGPGDDEVVTESEHISVENRSESEKEEASEYDADYEDFNERSDVPEECSKDILKEKFADGSSRSTDGSETSAEQSEESGDSTEVSEESVDHAAPAHDTSLAGTFASFLGISSLDGWQNGFGIQQLAQNPLPTDEEELRSPVDDELPATKNEDVTPQELRAPTDDELPATKNEDLTPPPMEEMAQPQPVEDGLPVQQMPDSTLEIEVSVEKSLETDDKADNDMTPEEENTEERTDFTLSEAHVEEPQPEEPVACQEPAEVLPVSNEVVEKKQGGKPAILPIAVVGAAAAAEIAGHCERKKTKRFKSFFRKDRKNDRSPKKGRGKNSARKGKAVVAKEETLERQPVEELKPQSTTVLDHESPVEVEEEKPVSASKRGSIFKKLRRVGSYRKGKRSGSTNEASMPADGGETPTRDVPTSPSKRRGLLSRFKKMSQRKLKKEAEPTEEKDSVVREPQATEVVEDVVLTPEAPEAEEKADDNAAMDREEKPSSFANLAQSLSAMSDWAPVIGMPLSNVLTFTDEEAKVGEQGQLIDSGKEEETTRGINTEESEEQMASAGASNPSTAFLSQLSNQIVNINIGIAAAQLAMTTNNCLQPKCDDTVAGVPVTDSIQPAEAEASREICENVGTDAAAAAAVPEVTNLEDSKEDDRQANENKSSLKTDESVNSHSLLVAPAAKGEAKGEGDAVQEEGGHGIISGLGQTLMSDLLFFDPVELVGTLRQQVVSTPVALPEDINLTEAAEQLHQKLFFTDLDEDKLKYSFSESKSFVPEGEEDAVDYLERKLFFTELGEASE